MLDALVAFALGFALRLTGAPCPTKGRRVVNPELAHRTHIKRTPFDESYGLTIGAGPLRVPTPKEPITMTDTEAGGHAQGTVIPGTVEGDINIEAPPPEPDEPDDDDGDDDDE